MSKVQSASSRTYRESPALSERQREGRAVNAVAGLLMRKLFVPKIFLESKVPNNLRVDLLAIDRAGSGDIHIVEFKLYNANIAVISKSTKALLNSIPAHFRYLAVDSGSLNLALSQNLFATDGIGRIGIIEIVEKPSTPPEARVIIQAERFRVDHSWIKKFDSFQKKTTADMEIRD